VPTLMLGEARNTFKATNEARKREATHQARRAEMGIPGGKQTEATEETDPAAACSPRVGGVDERGEPVAAAGRRTVGGTARGSARSACSCNSAQSARAQSARGSTAPSSVASRRKRLEQSEETRLEVARQREEKESARSQVVTMQQDLLKQSQSMAEQALTSSFEARLKRERRGKSAWPEHRVDAERRFQERSKLAQLPKARRLGPQVQGQGTPHAATLESLSEWAGWDEWDEDEDDNKHRNGEATAPPTARLDGFSSYGSSAAGSSSVERRFGHTARQPGAGKPPISRQQGAAVTPTGLVRGLIEVVGVRNQSHDWQARTRGPQWPSARWGADLTGRGSSAPQRRAV